MGTAYDDFMRLAFAEARMSLQRGNHGFGAVVVQDGAVIARAHDQEETDSDPTSHAELNAIRLASQKLGKNLAGCALIATHEPCPMCATALVWSGIRELAYGYSIGEAIAEGRRRIDLTCRELFERAGIKVVAHEGVLHEECSILYREDVRREVKRLRGAMPADLERLRDELKSKRLAWYRAHKQELDSVETDLLKAGYDLLCAKLEIEPEQAPIASRTDRQIVFHSRNFCPTLEACKLLDLDTRTVCGLVSAEPTAALLRQLDPRLRFSRNYDRLRPHAPYCEEIISLME